MDSDAIAIGLAILFAVICFGAGVYMGISLP